MGGGWVGGWVVKLKLKLNSDQLKLELGLSLAISGLKVGIALLTPQEGSCVHYLIETNTTRSLIQFCKPKTTCAYFTSNTIHNEYIFLNN